MTKKSKIKVFVLDDVQLTINGISGFLLDYDDLIVVGTALKREGAVDKIVETSPDVVLVDLNFDGDYSGDGVDTFEEARNKLKQNYELKGIVLTQKGSKMAVKRTIRAGLDGFLFKNDYKDLAFAIRKVNQGGVFFKSEVADYVIELARERQPELTDRQLEVLRFYVRGLPLKEIGPNIGVEGITEATVKQHLREVRRKAGGEAMTSRELVIWAIKEGYARDFRFDNGEDTD